MQKAACIISSFLTLACPECRYLCERQPCNMESRGLVARLVIQKARNEGCLMEDSRRYHRPRVLDRDPPPHPHARHVVNALVIWLLQGGIRYFKGHPAAQPSTALSKFHATYISLFVTRNLNLGSQNRSTAMASRASLGDYIVSLPIPTLILSFVGVAVFTNVLHRLARWARLRHVPGPPLAGWTSLWLTRASMQEGYLDHYQSLTEKYGPVVRVGPNNVLCSDIDTQYRISSARSQYKKGEWYTLTKVSRHGDHTISLLDPEARRERKKYIGPAVSFICP